MPVSFRDDGDPRTQRVITRSDTFFYKAIPNSSLLLLEEVPI